MKAMVARRRNLLTRNGIELIGIDDRIIEDDERA
jgi:hypothetical protein